MVPGTTPSALSRSAKASSRYRFLFVGGLVAVALTHLSAQPTRTPLRTVAVRLHDAAGWGVPAVDRQSVFYLSKHHELFSVERSTGRERWRQRLNAVDGLTQGIGVRLADGLVIVGDGDIFAFDADTGRRRWRRPAGELRAAGRFLGDVVDDAVIVGSASGRVAAIEVTTGQTRWQTAAVSVATAAAPVKPVAAVVPLVPVMPVRPAMPVVPVVNTDAVVLPEATAEAESAGDGRSEDRVVYVAYADFAGLPRRGGVVALSVRDGSVRSTWPFPESSGPASAAGRPVRAGSLAFVAATDGHVYGLGAIDGADHRAGSRVEWHWGPERLPFLADGVSDIRALAVAPGRVIISSLSGVLIGCSLAARGDCWRFSSPADGSNGFGVSVSVRQRLVFVPFASGRLGVVSLDAGHLVEMVRLPGSRFDWPPVSAGDQTFVVAEDGLYELRASDE